MRFSGQVKHAVEPLGKNTPHQIAVGNVSLDKVMARVMQGISEVGEVPRVGQRVQIDHRHICTLPEQIAHKIAADKSAAACYQYPQHVHSLEERADFFLLLCRLAALGNRLDSLATATSAITADKLTGEFTRTLLDGSPPAPYTERTGRRMQRSVIHGNAGEFAARSPCRRLEAGIGVNS
ncbi:hypothetical protein HRbin36_01793 [bacterium HR36]|nr:hypothetical protein HRbin36_01793 [bacterium HR36]